MSSSLEELQQLLLDPENEHLECKEAKERFDFELLVKYSAALANEGGGRIVLGVTDARPRRVVGSRAFAPIEPTKSGLVERLRLRIEADELAHPDGRVAELNEVLPGMSPTQVQNLLRELKRDGQAHPVGRTKAARWFPGPGSETHNG